jgi:uncharacterized protein YdhG (YjbR/CyaY superfamily)
MTMVVGASVSEYLARAPEPQRTALEQLREAVLSVVPEADEVIRRGVPAFRYRGKPLVSLGAARRHVSLFIMYGDVLKTHAADLEPYDVSNTVVRFDPYSPIPAALVTKLVRARATEIDEARQ